MSHNLDRVVTGFLICAVLVACGGSDARQAADTAGTDVTMAGGIPASAETIEESGPITLSPADFDGFEKGIARETQLVREAQSRSATAATPQARGEAIQATFDVNTIPAAAPVTGLSAERYKLVREKLSRIMTTLDFQGKIDGPQSVDTARAGPEMKARLASDPYAELDPASAAELRRRLDRIAPLWVEYITLTVVAG